MLADLTMAEGDWLVALAQDAGRGRQGRRWVGADGNFFGSTLVQVRGGDPPAPSLSLAAGLALIEAVDLAAAGLPLSLKWPNDLMLGQGKLGGILLERNEDRIVAGFGVNLAHAPDVPGRKTASLGGAVTSAAFAPLIAGGFARLLDLWRRTEPARFAEAWLARAHPVGTAITVHASADTPIAGTFDGLEQDGALRLRKSDGTLVIVRAGDVEL